MIKAGIYIDYKGSHYDVMGTAVHSQTGEPMVVYRPMDDDRKWKVQPVDKFSELVATPKGQIPRFRLVTSNEAG